MNGDGERKTSWLGEKAILGGYLDVYKHFHDMGWYWGAGFSRKDAMHFEVSDERVKEWI